MRTGAIKLRVLHGCRCAARLAGGLSATRRCHNARRSEVQSTLHSDAAQSSTRNATGPLHFALLENTLLGVTMATSGTFSGPAPAFLLPGIPSQLNAEISESGGWRAGQKARFKLRLWLTLICPKIDRHLARKQVVLLAFPLLFLDAFSCTSSSYLLYTNQCEAVPCSCHTRIECILLQRLRA